MANRLTNIERIGYGVWRFTWSGTSPYRVYKDGRLVRGKMLGEDDPYAETTTNTSMTVSTDDNDQPPQVEVLDSTDGTANQVAYPPYASISWRGSEHADRYSIQEYSGGAWSEIASVRERGDAGYYLWQSQALTDCTTHQFRVFAVNDDDSESGEVDIDIEIVRNPATPDASYSYDSGTGNVTVTIS